MTKKKTPTHKQVKTIECRMVFDFELPLDEVQSELDVIVKMIRDWLNNNKYDCNYHSQRILR